MPNRQQQTILVFKAVDRTRHIFLPNFHLFLFRNVDSDLEEVSAGDVFVPFEALM